MKTFGMGHDPIKPPLQYRIPCGLLAAALRTGVLLSTAAIAQAAQAQQDVIEEIIVTAQKREQSLQETPVSVTAFTAESIEARTMTNLQDINGFTPNLEINAGRPDGGASSASIYIRGVGQSDFLFPNDPGVGLYVDGVYFGRTLGGLMALSDLERIEVLRGPQGTLWGRNTIGGAVNIVTAKPQREFGFEGEVTTGSYDRIDGRLSLNVPLSDQFLARLSGASLNADGYGRELITGKERGDENKDTVRAQALWQPSDKLELLASADYSRTDEANWAGTLLRRECVPGFSSFPGCLLLVEGLYNGLVIPGFPGVFSGANADLGLPPGARYDNSWLTGNPFHTNGTDPSFVKNDIWGVSLTATWDVAEDLTAKSITSYRELDAKMARDGDHSPYRIVWTNDDNRQDQFSEELTFSGKFFDERLIWLAGMFYFEEHADEDNLVFILSGLCPMLDAVGPILFPIIPFPPGFPSGCGFGPTEAPLDIDFDIHNEIDVTSWAGFGQGTWDFNDRWSLTFGGRYTWENKEYFQDHRFQNLLVNFVGPRLLEESWNAFTPKVGLEWKVIDEVLAYFSASRGFKSGGWSPRPTNGNEGLNPFDPEFLWSYEIGAKTSWLGNRLQLNLAGFYNDYTDIQITTVASVGANLVLNVENAGEAEIYGFEMEAFALPVEHLELQAGIGYLHNEYTEIKSGATIPIDAKLPETPKWTLNLGAQYTFGLGEWGTLAVRGDGAYRSKTFKDPFNIEELIQESYWLLNSRLTYTSSDEHWQVALYGTNLTDEEYLTNGLHEDLVGAIEGYYGRPREWGVTVSYRF